MMLGDFLAAQAGRRRLAGIHDCCTFPADWAMLRGHDDPMADWRGAYDSEEGAEALIAQAGGLDALFATGMASVGIPRVDGEPQTGDIGVVRLVHVGDLSAGMIFAGKRWAFITDKGLGMASVEPELVVGLWRP